MMDIFDNWTVQARKGILEFTVLAALADKERYAYELVQSLVTVPSLGISEGTIYPLLSRLRLQGLVQSRIVESESGPARKYYRLTSKGQETLSMMDEYLNSIFHGVQKLRLERDSRDE